MAGIGFELRKILKEDSWSSLFKAYLYAGALGSGTWILSVLGILLVGMTGLAGSVGEQKWVSEFQVSVTWIMSGSLVTSGLLQLVFTRFVADCLYLNQDEKVIPNLLGATGLINVIACVLGCICLWGVMQWEVTLYTLLFFVSYILLCNVWMLVIFVAGLRRYGFLLSGFFLAYALIVLLAWLWRNYNLEAGLLAFFIGHGILLIWLLFAVLKEYPKSGSGDVSFEFLHAERAKYSLIITGLLLNLGIWVDKWLFWFYPGTSVAVNDFLRASPLHDPNIFLAYLAMIPGLASFLLRIETDFVDACQAYYRVLNTATLSRIEMLREEMLQTLSDALFEVIKVQGVTMILIWLLASDIVRWLGWPAEYAWFLRIDVFATSVLVIFIALLNVAFYFNFLKQALWMTAGLFVMNLVLTLVTLILGKPWYGAGFGIALLVITVMAGIGLSVKTKRLEYQTFMLQ